QVHSNGEVVQVQIQLASWGAISGTVSRQDGVTPAVGVRVSVGSAFTTTDLNGHYTLTLLPLGDFVVSVSDPGTRSLGRAKGTLVTQADTDTVHILLSHQAS